MKKLAMGIDIGGTNTAFGLVDEEGTVFCESVISTEKYKKFDDYQAYINALCEAMHALIDSVSFEFELIASSAGIMLSWKTPTHLSRLSLKTASSRKLPLAAEPVSGPESGIPPPARCFPF